MREQKRIEAELAEALAQEAALKTDLEPKPEPEEMKVEKPQIYEPTKEIDENNDNEEQEIDYDSEGNCANCG